MADPRALVEQARAEHERSISQPSRCANYNCQASWPCLAVRLAEALEQQIAILFTEVEEHCNYVSDTTNAALRLVTEKETLRARAFAAEARAERLAEWASERGHHYTCKGRIFDMVAAAWRVDDEACTCGLAAALGLAGGEGE